MPKNMHLAAMDLGSNSFHLLVARASDLGSLTKLASHKAVLRLGGVVQQHGYLPASSFDRALESVGEMLAVADAFQSEATLAVGTSALRDAKNGPEFCQAVWQRFGVPVELVSGKEEGELVYRGARNAFVGAAKRVAVIDIGGGSVEIAVGDGERSDFVESLPLGFLRLAELVAANGAASALELVKTRVLSGSWVVAERLRAMRPDAWVFSGGTARALGKLLISGPAGISGATVRHVAAELAKTKPQQLLELGVDATRVETLALGAAVFSALVEQFALTTLHVSAGGLREGVLLRELSRIRAQKGENSPSARASAPGYGL